MYTMLCYYKSYIQSIKTTNSIALILMTENCNAFLN